MSHGGRVAVLINAPQELPREQQFYKWWRKIAETKCVFLRQLKVVFFSTHKDKHTERHSVLQEVLHQGPVNPSEAEVYHGMGQCQSPWTRGVGQFHGTLDINARPLLEVNNSAHSITWTDRSVLVGTHIHPLCTLLRSPLQSELGAKELY